MNLTKEILYECGWKEWGGMPCVLYSNPRIGWYESGRTIVGYYDFPVKITTVSQMASLLRACKLYDKAEALESLTI